VRDSEPPAGLNTFMMQNPKALLAAALLLLLAGWAAWQIYSGWGLVTLDETNAPVSKVLASIERQSGVEIASNLDPSTPVTIKVRRVPAVEAIDITAIRTDASWRVVYLGAPDNGQIEGALKAFEAGGQEEGWTSHGSGGPGGMMSPTGTALDLRRVAWKPSGPGNLQDLLREASQKTGVSLSAPTAWNPAAPAPSGGEMRDAAPELFRGAGGVSREVFLLRASGERGGDGEWTERGRGGGGWIGRREERDEGRGGWGGMNPESIAERVEAQIALLPKEEQAKAREDFDIMRNFWASVRDLPEEERRAKAREFFTSPAMAERMEDRRLARDAKRTPEQRNERSRQYFERREAAKASQGGGQ